MKLSRILRTALKFFILTRGFRAVRRGSRRYGRRRGYGNAPVRRLLRRFLG